LSTQLVGCFVATYFFDHQQQQQQHHHSHHETVWLNFSTTTKDKGL
jgi:hypothetical protein